MKNCEKELLNSAERPIVLLVEDDPDFLWMIALGLKDEFRVLEADNGSSGLEKAFEEMPDLVVTDLMMPGMGGEELCRRLKTHPETSHIPVIMLTAKTSMESEIEGLETGADAYITKPFNSLLLKTRIRNLLQTRQLLRERFSRDFMVPDQPVIESPPDQQFLTQTFAVLESNFQNPDFTAEVFAEKMNMSLRSLHRKLKTLTHETPSKLIWNVRLKKAAALLQLSEVRISDIAYNVGYTESSHFSRQFRQRYGMTPSEYREGA